MASADTGVFGAAPVADTEQTLQQRYEQALRYLARTQGVSGAWAESPVATALVLLAFLQGGHSDRAGNFTPQLGRATRWLIDQVGRSGSTPAVAWALAVLADTTAATAHIAARDAALANATPAGDLDQACLALARGEQIQLPAGKQQLTTEQDALALALHLFSTVAATAEKAAELETQQQAGGSAAGAVVPPGCNTERPDATVFAATASAALAWRLEGGR